MPSTLSKRRSSSTSKSTAPTHPHDVDQAPRSGTSFNSLQPHDQNQIDLKPSSSTYNTPITSNPNNQNSSRDHPNPTQTHPNPRPLACGRRRRHTISNNHIEFMFYHCLRDDIDEEDEDEHDEDEDEDEDSSYHRISARRQDQQSLFDIHHCDVIVLKTDNGWCFDQDIFLPAWKRDAYEAAGQEDGFSGQELVKVDEIRVD